MIVYRKNTNYGPKDSVQILWRREATYIPRPHPTQCDTLVLIHPFLQKKVHFATSTVQKKANRTSIVTKICEAPKENFWNAPNAKYLSHIAVSCTQFFFLFASYFVLVGKGAKASISEQNPQKFQKWARRKSLSPNPLFIGLSNSYTQFHRPLFIAKRGPVSKLCRLETLQKTDFVQEDVRAENIYNI